MTPAIQILVFSLIIFVCFSLLILGLNKNIKILIILSNLLIAVSLAHVLCFTAIKTEKLPNCPKIIKVIPTEELVGELYYLKEYIYLEYQDEKALVIPLEKE